MNINAVNFNQAAVRNTKTKVQKNPIAQNSFQNNLQNNFYKNFPYQNYCSINFTSKESQEDALDVEDIITKMADTLCEGIESETYKEDLEFDLYRHYKNIKSQDERISDLYLLSAIKCAFLIVEDEANGQKYYDTTAVNMTELITGCYNSIGCNEDPIQLMEICKEEDNSVNLINAILNFRTISDFSFNVKDEIIMAKKYFINDEGEMDPMIARAVAVLLNEGNCIDYQDYVNLMTLVTNSNGAIDKSKFDFTFKALKEINQIQDCEIPPEIISEFAKSINQRNYAVIKIIQDNSKDENGNFDYEKAKNMFTDFTLYAINEKARLNQEIKIKIKEPSGNEKEIPINDISENSRNEKYFNNSIYRLYRLLT